jgi:hypothetical protein
MKEKNGATGLQPVPVGADLTRGRTFSFLRQVGLPLALGYIFFFFAERVFWSTWRVGTDTVVDLLATWLVYSIAGALCLALIHQFRVRSLWAMFLVGAVLGWLVEGVIMMTFFGTAEIPFPYTIAWTGLSWHALIVVVFGWYGLQTALLRSFAATALLSAAFGIFWGIWSIFWTIEQPTPSAGVFSAHAWLATSGLTLAFPAFHGLDAQYFDLPRSAKLFLAAFIILYFFAITVAHFGWLALLTLPPLFGLVLIALRCNAAAETRPDFLVFANQTFPWTRTLAIYLMPALASLIYEGCRWSGLKLPTNIAVFLITLPAGFVGFTFSLWKVCRLGAAGPSRIGPQS